MQKNNFSMLGFFGKNGKRIINDQRKFIFAIITKIPVKVQKKGFKDYWSLELDILQIENI